MTASQGAADTTEAMTDPRPRVTNRTGNAQQTSVVSDDARPRTVLTRSVRIDPSFWTHAYTSRPGGKDKSDEQNGRAQMRRTVRKFVGRTDDRECGGGP